jgi:hypothetical protein
LHDERELCTTNEIPALMAAFGGSRKQSRRPGGAAAKFFVRANNDLFQASKGN